MAVEKRITWDWDYRDPKDSLLMRVADNRGVRRRKRIKTFKHLVSYFIFTALFLMLMAVAGWRFYAYLITSPRFIIESIHVNTTNFLNRETLNVSLAEIKGRNIFLLDLNQVQKKFEENPWVDYCFIKRVLPNKLTVEITEETLALVLREACLQRGAVYLENFGEGISRSPEEQGNEASSSSPGLTGFVRELDSFPGPVFLSGEKSWGPGSALKNSIFISCAFSLPSFSERKRLWELCLKNSGHVSDEADLEDLAARFKL